MSDLNSAVLSGIVLFDPELRYTSEGTAGCNTRVNATYKRGEKEYSASIAVVLWGDDAETVSGAGQGAYILVQGRIQNRKWTDKSGADHWETEVVAERATVAGINPAPAVDEADEDQSPPDDDDIPF